MAFIANTGRAAIFRITFSDTFYDLASLVYRGCALVMLCCNLPLFLLRGVMRLFLLLLKCVALALVAMVGISVLCFGATVLGLLGVAILTIAGPVYFFPRMVHCSSRYLVRQARSKTAKRMLYATTQCLLVGGAFVGIGLYLQWPQVGVVLFVTMGVSMAMLPVLCDIMFTPPTARESLVNFYPVTNWFISGLKSTGYLIAMIARIVLSVRPLRPFFGRWGFFI